MHTNSPEEDVKEIKPTPDSRLIDEKLFKSRSFTLFGEINDKISKVTAERLLALAADGDDPITLFICSPGGHVESGDVIYDLIKFIKPDVKVIGTGWVASSATTIYLAAKKENRFSLPNTRFLVHQPSGGSRGVASDIQIQAEQIIKTRSRINELIAKETGQPLERVARDTDRDYWMNAQEATEYGIVNKIIKTAAEM